MADVSGANLNPAVSVGLLLGKRISVERFVFYVIAQVLYTVFCPTTININTTTTVLLLLQYYYY